MAEFVHGVFQLLRGQVRELQGGRGQGDKPVGMFSHPRGKSFVVDTDDVRCQIPVGSIPPIPVDAQSLVVDAAFVHVLQAVRAEGLPGGKTDVRKIRLLQNVGDLRKDAMRVNVHCSGPPGADVDLASRGLGE